MASPQEYPRQSSSTVRPHRHSRQSGGASALPHEENPSRSSQPRRPRPSREEERRLQEARDGPDLSLPRRPRAPLGPEPSEEASQIFDFIYHLIYSLVHMGLTVILAPVLSGKREERSRRTTTTEGRERSWDRPPLSPVVEDPECGMSVGSDDRSDAPYRHPILKTQQSRRSSDFPASFENGNGNKKSVRFPAPERSRPPLGRIGSLKSSAATVGSTSTASTSSSLSRSSSSTGSDSSGASSRRDRSWRASHGDGRAGARRRSSPLGRLASPRMNHSTYFLE